MNSELLSRMQKFTARYAGSAATFRGRQKGTVEAAREFLGGLALDRFVTSDPARFRRELNSVTDALTDVIPGKEWGFARNAVNIFLRDCLYNTYLRERYGLTRAEPFMEIALGWAVADALRKRDRTLPAWTNTYSLDRYTNHQYQSAADRIAGRKGFARVHLDALYWTRMD